MARGVSPCGPGVVPNQLMAKLEVLSAGRREIGPPRVKLPLAPSGPFGARKNKKPAMWYPHSAGFGRVAEGGGLLIDPELLHPPLPCSVPPQIPPATLRLTA